MAEKLCLKWNDFEENVKSSFESLREDNNFNDVTLACEDGQQFEAHKVILASSSPFFQNILKGIKHAHPLLYLRGMKVEDISAILDFLYCGEANVYQENLESFLAIAEELQLKGLTGQKESESTKNNENDGGNSFDKRSQGSTFTQDNKCQPKYAKKLQTNENLLHIASDIKENNVIAIPRFLTEETQAADLEEKVKSMMEKSSNMIANGKSGQIRASICKVCGKEGLGRNIKRHIEANHLDGVYLHPCNICQKTCRSRNMLWEHKHMYHKE